MTKDEALHRLRLLLARTNPNTEAARELREILIALDPEFNRLHIEDTEQRRLPPERM